MNVSNFSYYNNVPYRSELSGIQTTLQEKELSRVETSVELQALQELHNNEKIAMEHARKLARYCLSYIL